MSLVAVAGLGDVRNPSYKLREIPSWCNWYFVGGAADILGAGACQPYTREELERQARSDAEYAANSPSSTIPPGDRLAYIEEAVRQSNEAQAAAQRSDPQGTCEYNASLGNSLGARIFGTGLYCNPDGTPSGFDGRYLTYGAFALGAVLLVVLLKR